VLAERPSPLNDSDIVTTMAVPSQEPSLSEEQRHALALLASIPHGITEDLLALAHGFDRAVIGGLVGTGLATAQREIVSGRTTIEVVRIRISDAGRRAIER
jgi:hypothetical protein